MAKTGETGDAEGADPKTGSIQRLITIGGGVIGLWGAAMTVVTAYNTSRLQNLENNLSQLKEERVWAKELYAQYDAIVTNEAQPQAQLDRLNGLLALAELTDQKPLKDQWSRLIKQQAARYGARVTETQPNNPATQALVQQFEQLERAASATAVQAKPVWSNYDFDIFWCPGAANQAAAEAIAKVKQEDPNAVGNWRVRQASKAWTADKAPYSIVWDYKDEEPIAHSLAARLQSQGPAEMQGAPLRILHSTRAGSRWYLSVFVCQ
jgi:hypothetical protein